MSHQHPECPCVYCTATWRTQLDFDQMERDGLIVQVDLDSVTDTGIFTIDPEQRESMILAYTAYFAGRFMEPGA